MRAEQEPNMDATLGFMETITLMSTGILFQFLFCHLYIDSF